jgi:hypothetical protein
LRTMVVLSLLIFWESCLWMLRTFFFAHNIFEWKKNKISLKNIYQC